MNDSFREALSDVLDYLLALQHDGVPPREAQARLQPLRGRHPGLGINLLSEVQAFDQSIHYDALLRRAGEGTVSLSYCAERAVPWPLRGVQRQSEGDLVRVNTNVLRVDTAMACLDFIWDEASIIERLVNMCLIQEELEREPIDLTNAELQEAMNRFRSAKKLFKADDTLRWLERHGMTHDKLERYVSDSAVVPKLRDRIAEGRVDEYFRQHPGDFDSTQVARLQVAHESQASELAGQIRSGTQDFFAVAARLFFAAAEHGAPPKASLFALIERRHAEPALRDQLFSAAPGQLVGPVPLESGYVLMRVMAITPAELNDRTRNLIKEVLFKDWLTEQRKAATIEWSWGNVSKAPDSKQESAASPSSPPNA